MVRKFPHYRQFDTMDCGPTCLKMIARYYGQKLPLNTLRTKAQIERDGVSLLGLSEAAESIGYRTVSAEISWDQLKQKATLPCIVHWNANHFVVVYKIKRNKVYVADPAKGLLSYPKERFMSSWTKRIDTDPESDNLGVVLLLYPTPKIFEKSENKSEDISLTYIFRYLIVYKKIILQLGLGFFVGSLIQLMLPFLTQSLVDVGIKEKAPNFIGIILVAQFFLLAGQVSIEFVRSWIVLHISTRLNISILSDFISKLMKLPIRYFDTRKTGDILQRIDDHKRVEEFMSVQTLSVIFSLFNIVVFSIVLVLYNKLIFIVYVISSIIYIAWILLFLKFRKKIDIERFEVLAKNQNSTIQIIQGIQDIKLTNSETQKRWGWEKIQTSFFSIQIKTLTMQQIQEVGAFFINQGKNIVVTFLSAMAVLHSELTLGEMLSIQFIIGQLNAPLQQSIGFIQTFQDAKLSLERLNEIHKEENEESQVGDYITGVTDSETIEFIDVSFMYPGAGNQPVLKNINLKIPQGQITALVGASGSGKTSIVKLLLKFYTPSHGRILFGGKDFRSISPKVWRSYCGSVLQESFIFSDTILNNISVGFENVDLNKVRKAAKIANIDKFIETLPLKYETMIGSEGIGISQGQRQRILIARAVFRDPKFIFLDEATNALDANNESSIMENLNTFMEGRTAIIVAHRLSTVQKADNIIVLKDGEIVEEGTHINLLGLRGEYYKLVTKQLSPS